MAIEVPITIVEVIVAGWLFALGVSVLDSIDRRSHRKDIYDLMKLNLSALMEDRDLAIIKGK